jgi:hypothetical protein
MQRQIGTISVRTSDGVKPIEDQIQDSRNAMNFLTDEIDRLSKRLVEYDALLTAKLSGFGQHERSSVN